MKTLSDFELKRLKLSAYIPILFVCVLWVIYVFSVVFDFDLRHFGVYPFKIKGLVGILFSPLIHANTEHLFSNTLPLLILGTMLFYFYNKTAFRVFIILYFGTGIWVWLGARPAYHIGSSGIVYGLSSFIFTSGALIRSIRLMAVSLLVVFLYGSLIWGLFPIDWKISWESHLSGFIIGIFLAFYFKKDHEYLKDPVPEYLDDEDDDINQKSENNFWEIDDDNITSTY